MNESLPIAQKVGCGKYALDNCILVKAPVESASAIIQEYFELKIQVNCKVADYIEADNSAWREVKRQREIRDLEPNKSLLPILWAVPFWQYFNHQWAVLPFLGTYDSIAFALALLLNTYVITFDDNQNASHNEFKVFHKDKLVENYVFGFECGEDFKNNWDIKIEELEFDDWYAYEHRFKSSIRRVTEAEVKSAVLSRKHDRDNRGFLDACLKYYEAYIPSSEETPDFCKLNLDFQKIDSIIERMDVLFLPSNWKYLDRKVPNQVT